MKTLKCLVLVLAAIATSVAFADDTITLNLTADCTFAEALAAYNATHGTAYVDSDNGATLGTKDVEVNGGYTMTVSKLLPSWTGNLIIKSGASVYGNLDNSNYATAFGANPSGTTTNGQVFVESGASLKLRVNTNNNGYKVYRPIHVAGTGADGKGALQVSSTSNARAMWPFSIHLDADATIARLGSDSFVNGGSVMSGNYLFLNGHILTFGAAGVSGMPLIFENVNVHAPGATGGITITGGMNATMRVNRNWAGGSGNVFRINNDARLGTQDDMPSAAWDLYYDTDNTIDPGNYVDRTRDETGAVRCWIGSVTLARTFRFIDNTAWVLQSGFRGKTTGPGGIVLNGYSGDRNAKWFHLESGANDFTGGLAATNFLVRLRAPTALPSGSGAGAASFKDCDIDLNYDYMGEDFTFPATEFNGSGKIYSKVHSGDILHRGRIASLTKTGTGTLDIQAQLDGGAINVARGGTVKLARASTEAEQRLHAAGMNFGQSRTFTSYSSPFANADAIDIGGGSRALRDVAPYILYTNSTVRTPTIFTTPHGSFTDSSSNHPWKNTFYQKLSTYDGYFWNDSAEAKTVRIICTLNAYVQLTIGSQTFYNGEPSRNMKPDTLISPKGVWTATIQPGANRFEVRAFDRYGLPGNMEGENYFCYGNVCTNGLANWDDTHGLVWSEKTNSVDLNDFHLFEDDGTGTTLTKCDTFIAPYQHLTSLTGTGVIDLDGGVLKVDHAIAEPYPQIVNGRLEATFAPTSAYPERLVLGAGSTVTIDVDCQEAAVGRDDVAGTVYGYQVSNNPETHAGYVNMDGYGWSIRSNGGILRVPYDFDMDQFGKSYGQSWAQVGNVRDHAYRTYSGYIWSDAATNETWTFMSTEYGIQQLTVGNETSGHLYPGTPPTSGGKPAPYRYNLTVKPGANYFEAVYGNHYVSVIDGAYNYGVVATNGLSNWTVADYCTGMLFDRMGRSTLNRADYERFVADEVKPTLTHRLPTAFSFVDIGEGSTVDLSARDNRAVILSGAAKFENGTMEVVESWHLTKALLEDSDAAVASCLKFAQGSELVIDDATAAEVLADMPVGGYLLATDVDGTVAPKVKRDASDVRLRTELVKGSLYLRSGAGTLIIVK